MNWLVSYYFIFVILLVFLYVIAIPFYLFWFLFIVLTFINIYRRLPFEEWILFFLCSLSCYSWFVSFCYYFDLRKFSLNWLWFFSECILFYYYHSVFTSIICFMYLFYYVFSLFSFLSFCFCYFYCWSFYCLSYYLM